MQDNFLQPKKHYMSWPVMALLDFVTIISFENIFYPFQNQGLSVVVSWVFLLFAYIIPYELIVSQLSLTFDNQSGGLASWVRRGGNDTLGYWTSWMYWIQSVPYIVDVSNSVIVSFSWMVLGNNTLGNKMSTFEFGLLTFIIILVFILLENLIKNSLEILSLIGGGAMFIMSLLFVLLAGYALMNGTHIATQPFNLGAFMPHFSLKYFSTTGLLIFAMSGAELAAPYIVQMRDPKHEFPKAMWLLALMTAFLTIFGTLSLAIFFNANAIPHDFKMNGPYYAFSMLGAELGVGKLLMYIFAVVQAIFMMAQLAVLLDASSRVFAGDVADRFMPSWLMKKNKKGLPVNSYLMTTGLSLFLLLLTGTLPNINTIYNWLLNINGIVSPYKTCWVFFAFLAIRWREKKFKSDYVFIRNRKFALLVGGWCFLFTFVCATLGFIPQDAAVGTKSFDHQLLMNFITVFVLFGVGLLLPYLRKRELRK
ncbi:APC family permease [Liquorilactobacillus cacaonum]|uniref:Amino acid transporter n=1 Tax=Liquorilactobacillus cacaonum DSM 21116 TaxID=1423729 RepID=A0A0R2CK37_9LACO|nr:APC family permease [Liquorilactobacillus cacaonum]KRM92013.1 amino acid transporter [Liquorilactobacillus cacaonum DSM 21116]